MTVEAADVMRIQMQITYDNFFDAVVILQLGEDVYGEGFKTELHRLSVNTGKNTWYYIKGRCLVSWSVDIAITMLRRCSSHAAGSTTPKVTLLFYLYLIWYSQSQ